MTTRVIMNTSRPNGSGGTYEAGVEYDLADDLAELWRGQGICRRTSVRSEQTGAVVSATAGNFPDAPGQSQDLPLTVRQSAQGNRYPSGGVVSFGGVRQSIAQIGGRKLGREAAMYYPATPATSDIAKAPIDISGNGIPMTLGAGLPAADLWAAAGYASPKAGTLAGTFKHPSRPNFSTDLYIVAFKVNMATPAGLIFFGGTAGLSASETGFMLGVSTDAKLRCYTANGTAVTGQLLPATGTVADGSDHSVLIVCDPETKAIYFWVDGVLIYSKQNALSGMGQATHGMYFGSHVDTVAAASCKFKDISVVHTSAYPAPYNLSTVAASYHASGGDIYQYLGATRSAALFVAGQSNQMGTGVTAATNTGLGTPLQDPTYLRGNSGKRSFYPATAAAVGRQGIKLDVFNHARGGSALSDSWCGHLKNWVSGENVKAGSYRILNGVIFKANPVTTDQNAMPISTTPPAAGTGADGVPWIEIGPYLGQHMGPQQPGDTLFDPLGNVAEMIASLQSSRATTKVVYLASGESDANMNRSRSDYSAALVSIANACIAAGADHILIGHTFGTPGGVYQARYDASLVPAISDAVSALGSDVATAGANLYTALGLLSVSPASGIGTIADALHGNDPAYDAGAAVLGSALVDLLDRL